MNLAHAGPNFRIEEVDAITLTTFNNAAREDKERTTQMNYR